jgi:hypothetical protein
MKTAANQGKFAGFDFTNVWGFISGVNDDYPILRAFKYTVPVTGVSLDKTSLALKVDATATLIATVAPDDATNKAVTWSSSDESVATVEDGEVTAIAEGEATITVTTVDGDFSAYCAVTVTEDTGGGDDSLTLAVDYVTETIKVKNATDLSLHSYAVEIGGKIKLVEPLYSNTIAIPTKLIPKKPGKDVKIALINVNAVVLNDKANKKNKGFNMYNEADIMSDTVTLSIRQGKMAKTEVSVDYTDKVLKGSGAYDYKTSWGTWQRIELSSTSSLSIAGFLNSRTGGVLHIRKAATATNAAGPEMKLKIKPKK